MRMIDDSVVSAQKNVEYLLKEHGVTLGEYDIPTTLLIIPKSFLTILEKDAAIVIHKSPFILKKLFDIDLYIELLSGRKVALAYIGKGSPMMAIRTEQYITLGFKEIIFIGFCGSIVSDVHYGDIILVDKIKGDCGIIKHYLPRQNYINISNKLFKKASDLMKDLKHNIRSGSVWCTDGFYRETIRKIKKMKKHSAIVVEMETAGLFSVTSFYKIDAIACLIVTDELSDYKWRQYWHQAIEKSGDQILSFIKKIIEKN